MVIALMLLVLVGGLIAAAIQLSQTAIRTSSTRAADQQAIQVAESGIERAVWCLNNPLTCGSNFTGETNQVIGQGRYDTAVSVAGTTATISATATVDSPSGPVVKQISASAVIAASTKPAFAFGVQAGIGGIHMDNNAHVDGNIYTSGPVTGGNGSYIDGDAILTPSPGTLDVVANPPVSPTPNTVNFGLDGDVNDYVAQSFVPTISDRLYSVDLKIARVDSPTSSVTVAVYSDNSDRPGSDLTDGGQLIDVVTPDAAGNWWGTNTDQGTGWTTQPFNPDLNPILTAGQKYWLVLKTNTTSPTRYWRLATSASDTIYPGGTAKIGGSVSTMSAACGSSCDLAFRLTIGGVNPTLQVPHVNKNAYAYTIDSTIVGEKAYYWQVNGTVEANAGGQTCTNSSNSGYCFSQQPNKPSVTFPVSDAQISVFEDQAAQGGIEATNCNVTDTTIGPKEYDCDLTLNGTVTLNGSVWVKGNISITNGAILQLAPGYSTNSGVIVADNVNNRTVKGQITLSNNGDLRGNSTAGTYIMAISTHQDPTASLAIDVQNNLTAGVLYAPYGVVSISNNASLKEVTAYALRLAENSWFSQRGFLLRPRRRLDL
jgi:hypothetical protein